MELVGWLVGWLVGYSVSCVTTSFPDVTLLHLVKLHLFKNKYRISALL